MKSHIREGLPASCLAIPTYNRENILVQTLQAASDLDPAPSEILVVDQTPEHEKTTEDFS